MRIKVLRFLLENNYIKVIQYLKPPNILLIIFTSHEIFFNNRILRQQ